MHLTLVIMIFFFVYFMCLTIGNDSINKYSVPEAIMLHALSFFTSVGIVVLLT